jgi:hypothetical protein
MAGREDGPPGHGRPDDLLEFGRDRRAGSRWRSRAILASLVLVTSLLVAGRAGLWSSSPGHSAPGRQARGRTSGGPTSPVRVFMTRRHLFGVTGDWELLARGPDDLLRIQLAAGRIIWSVVPPLETSSPAVSFVATDHEAIIRPADFVPGYVVPDGGQARLLTGPLADGGPLIPGAEGTETTWVSGETQTTRKLSLIALNGRRLGPVIRFPARGPQLPATAVSDGRGDVLVASSTFTSYDVGPTWDLPVPGTIIAVGPANWLTVICDKNQRCRNEVVSSADWTRRLLPSPGSGRPDRYFFTWPPAGVIAPDGDTAAVVGRVVAGQGRGPANAVHLVNLRTGATKDLDVRVGEPVTIPLAAATGDETLAWSPDSRWLFVASADGKLFAVNARSDRVESLGIALPSIEQVTIRP